MMMSNAALFRRYYAQQDALTQRTMPNTPVREYDLPDIDLTKLLGRTSQQQWHAVQKEA